MSTNRDKLNVLYVFGGERAQGAEIVIERLMAYDTSHINAFLLIAPGEFATKLQEANKTYAIVVSTYLRKLNRSSSGKLTFLLKAAKNYLQLSYKIWSCIRKFDIDLVHANTIVPAVYALPLIPFSAVFRPSLKWVWSDHDMRYFSGLEIRLSKICSKLYDGTFVVSNAVSGKYPGNQRVKVLYNGLDTSVFRPNKRFREDFRTEHLADTTAFVIGMAASICPGKGQLALLQVFEKLQLSQPDAVLVLAGAYAADDQQYNARVKEKIAAMNHVFFLGQLEDMVSFYNACDILVNNSDALRSESLGTSIYEAMACETLVVASATGGTPEIITNGQDGILFEPDNEQALFTALKLAMDSRTDRSRLTRSARIKVQKKFSISEMANRYNQLIYSFFSN